MRACDDGYPSCRAAEAGGKWCDGPCAAGQPPNKRCEIRLTVPVTGTRYKSDAGEVRTILWRGDTVPRVVSQVRAQEPIDWGGSMVRHGDYEVVRDTGADRSDSGMNSGDLIAAMMRDGAGA